MATPFTAEIEILGNLIISLGNGATQQPVGRQRHIPFITSRLYTHHVRPGARVVPASEMSGGGTAKPALRLEALSAPRLALM